MIVVKIELWPGGDPKHARRKELGRMYIANDGSHPAGNPGSQLRGSYDAKVCRKGFFAWRGWDWVTTTRTGRVENFPRQSYSIWRLIARALKSAFPEER